MVQLADYQASLDSQAAIFGGQTTVDDLDNLNKAIAAGDTTGRETTNLTTASGAPLKVESLEKTLKILTHSQKDVVLWKNVPKSAAYNTVEEYNQLTSYGADRGGFNNEGELPVEEDSTYVRRAQLIKFLGVVKSVTHPMTLVNTMVGNIIEREITNGTLWILRKLDKALYSGDSAIIPQEFNGFYTQHQKNDAWSNLDAYMQGGAVVDLRGDYLHEKHIEDAANNIIENFGLGDEMYAPPKVLSDFVKNFYGNKFIQPNTEALTNGVMGQKVKSFESQFGNIGLNYDIFANPPGTKTTVSAATSNSAPAAPTADGSTPNNIVTGDASSLFVTAEAGNYYYAVSAINRYGESALTVLGTAAAVVAGCRVDLKFTATASPNATTGYVIYRSNKGAASAAAATFYPLFTVSTADLAAGYDGAAALAIGDRNRFLPGTYQAFMIQQNTEVMEFKQLAPLMKMDLAVIAPAFRFMVLLYGTPFLYVVKKMVRFINVGKAA